MTVIDHVPGATELDEEVIVAGVPTASHNPSTTPGPDVRGPGDDETYLALVDRLNRQSVDKHYDPFVDIAWDDPDLAIDVTDPRWARSAEVMFGRTAWFRSLDPAEQSRLGLFRIASAMKLGLEFENILKRGLLEYAFKLPNGTPEFRYLYHETIEEAHHGLMFQEFVNRTGLPVEGLAWWEKVSSRRVVALARWFPSLFFLFVLGGEDPIDHQQRQVLREGGAHPLVERIMRIHVTEEARHLSFARHHLKHEVPRLKGRQRLRLSIAAPVLLGQMARQMLLPPRQLVREFQIPKATVRELSRSPEARAEVSESLHKVRRLCVELGLVNRLTVRLWKANDIWADPT
ncbi:MAG: AurF N-oxygenase family protein [Acidimicrobiales bacterium]